MKRKLLLWSLLLIVTAATIGTVPVSAATVVAFDPPAVTIDEPGITCTVNIKVTDVTNLLLWVVDVTWDPSIIRLTTGDDTTPGLEFPSGSGNYYGIYEGPFLKPSIGLVVVDISNTAGNISGLTCGRLATGKSGSGVLVTFNFTGVGIGTTDLRITGPTAGHSELRNALAESIAHEDRQGEITVMPEFSGPILAMIFLTITLITVVLAKKTWSKRRRLDSVNLKRNQTPVRAAVPKN